MQIPTVLRLPIVAASMCFLQSCGGGGSDGTTQPGGTNSSGNVLTLFPPTVTTRQAELAVVVASVVRAGGYSGPLTFSVEGAPTGTDIFVATPSTSGASTAATMSLTPGLSVPVGTYNLTVRAKGTGVADATATLPFTVTGAQAQFSLVPLTRTLSIPAGGRDSTLVLVARNAGFTGAVTLSLLNAPAGITATSNPATVGASVSQAWLTLNTTAGDVRKTLAQTQDAATRLGELKEEVEALRASIPAMLSRLTPPPDSSFAVDPNAVSAAGGAAPPGPVQVPPSTLGLSPERMFNTAVADYAGGNYVAAIQGFQEFLKAFPTSPRADDAQQFIGDSEYLQNHLEQALAAYNLVIQNYPKGDQVAWAYFKRGQVQSRLGQTAGARVSFETVVKQFPDTVKRLAAI